MFAEQLGPHVHGGAHRDRPVATARRIRQQPWGKAVLLAALTGWGQAEDKRRATEAGFDCHFTKPVTPASLNELTSRIQQRGA